MMAETTIKVRLKEMTTVRVVCNNRGCGGVIEIPVPKLLNLSLQNAVQCPACHRQLVANTTDEPLAALCRIIDRINLLEGDFTLEFPIQIEDGRPAS